MKFDFKKIGNICHGQDGAIYNNNLFRFSGDGSCRVYDLNRLEPVADGEAECIASFKLDRSDEICPHSNAVCFGAEKYDESDEFPLLYTNIYNAYDRKEDEKHYIVTELGPEYGPDAWLTVIPKDRHHQQLELPKSFVTHDKSK